MKISNASVKPEFHLETEKCRNRGTIVLDFVECSNKETSHDTYLFPQKLSNYVLARKKITSVECSMLSCILYRNYVHSGDVRNIKKIEEF